MEYEGNHDNIFAQNMQINININIFLEYIIGYYKIVLILRPNKNPPHVNNIKKRDLEGRKDTAIDRKKVPVGLNKYYIKVLILFK